MVSRRRDCCIFSIWTRSPQKSCRQSQWSWELVLELRAYPTWGLYSDYVGSWLMAQP